MTTSLPERYVAATIKELPERLHRDVKLELQASIADAVEARLEQGEEREAAERAVLTDLGDPAVLAAGLADRPLQLIGPRYYLMWWNLLKRLMVILPSVVFIAVLFGQIIANADIGEMIGEAVAAALSVLVHTGFWVTLVFAVLERTGADTGMVWTVDQLPELEDQRHGVGDLVGSLVFLLIMIFLVLWDQTRAFIHTEGQAIPLLNPELWPGAMLGLLAIIVAEMIIAIMLYLAGRWTIMLAIINTILAGLFVTWVITLLAQGELFSSGFLDLWTANNVGADTLYTLGVILAFGVAIICLWDIIDGWVKAYRESRKAVENASSHQG